MSIDWQCKFSMATIKKKKTENWEIVSLTKSYSIKIWEPICECNIIGKFA